MRTYAGIGSRSISEQESWVIRTWAAWLKIKGYTLISGNAEGADIAFQEGSQSDCFVMLPWTGFNEGKYNLDHSRGVMAVGDMPQGRQAVFQYHPNPSALSNGALALQARNYYQVCGLEAFRCPPVDFVLCCADPDSRGGVKGGTGQAVRIAQNLGIPVFNMRSEGWKEGIIQQVNGGIHE